MLTNERLFFFEKSLLGQETVEEFSLKSITSLDRSTVSETHSRADGARGYPIASADDPLVQLEKLASLRDRGIISEEEFEQKKGELMKRT